MVLQSWKKNEKINMDLGRSADRIKQHPHQLSVFSHMIYPYGYLFGYRLYQHSFVKHKWIKNPFGYISSFCFFMFNKSLQSISFVALIIFYYNVHHVLFCLARGGIDLLEVKLLCQSIQHLSGKL